MTDTAPKSQDTLFAAIDAARNQLVEANGLYGHFIDTHAIVRLLKENQHTPYFEAALTRVTEFAPRLVLEQAPLYADRNFAPTMVMQATRAALDYIYHYDPILADALPYELPGALLAMEKEKTLSTTEIPLELAKILVEYERLLRTVSTEHTEFAEPNSGHYSFSLCRHFFDAARMQLSASATVAERAHCGVINPPGFSRPQRASSPITLHIHHPTHH